jgi:hypothetical protein
MSCEYIVTCTANVRDSVLRYVVICKIGHAWMMIQLVNSLPQFGVSRDNSQVHHIGENSTLIRFSKPPYSFNLRLFVGHLEHCGSLHELASYA